MKLERLLELSGQQGMGILKELSPDGIDVKYNEDNIDDLKYKLKKAGVDISNMSDYDILKFANATSKITIESLQQK